MSKHVNDYLKKFLKEEKKTNKQKNEFTVAKQKTKKQKIKQIRAWN